MSVDGAVGRMTSTRPPPTTFASQPNDSASRRTCQRPVGGNATASSRSSQPGRWPLVVVLIVAIVIVVLRKPDTPPTALPPTAVPPTAVPPTTKKPRPEFQDASCPDVQLISIPGTWESSPRSTRSTRSSSRMRCCSTSTNPIRAQFGQRSAGDVHRSVHRAVPQSAVGGQADVVQRQPRRGHPRRGEGDDGHEQPLPADQLRVGRVSRRAR